MVKEGRPDVLNREFTRMSRFESTVQATYLSNLVMKHVAAGAEDRTSREEEFRNLDIALHSFCSALIPPPQKASGRYCGAFGVRTRELSPVAYFSSLLILNSAAISLYMHYLSLGEQQGNLELVAESIHSLQGVTRVMTLSARTAITREPFDLDKRAFWTHSLFAKAALIQKKYNVRDEQWESDIEALKQYLRYFAPRYKIHGMFDSK
jgi:hypothetical protein